MMSMERQLRILAVFTLIGFCYGEEMKAKCVVQKDTGYEGSPPIEGTIWLTQPESGDIRIEVSLKGFTQTENVTKHGFHIHQDGNLTMGCLAAGGHFNPFNKDHGAPGDTERHVGDLGNLLVQPNGTADVMLTDRMIKLTGDNSVIGLAFVIHEGEDDLGKGGQPDSKISGHAGARMACCQIVKSTSNTSKASHLTSPLIVHVIILAAALLW